MRKIIVLAFMSLDGVMQAPGGPDEDPSNGFAYGGWTAPFMDETSHQYMDGELDPADLLLGRKTFDIFESYWPLHAEHWPGINEVKKYVLSRTRSESNWSNVHFLKDVEAIRAIKSAEGGDLKVWGSSELVHLLLQHELVDELWLKIFPVTLGKGKKLFNDAISPSSFQLTYSATSPGGIIFTRYSRAGEVKTGTVGA